MDWEFDNERPIYFQLAELIKIKIISGEYKAGQKVEPVRELANKASVNPNTMQKALQELERENLLFSKRTSGRYITEDINIINNMREDIAKQKITDFYNSMKKLGFSKTETLEIIEKLLREME